MAPGVELKLGSFIVPKETVYSTEFSVEIAPYSENSETSDCPWYYIVVEKENDDVGLYTKKAWVSLPYTTNEQEKTYNYNSQIKVFFSNLASETKYFISVY